MRILQETDNIELQDIEMNPATSTIVPASSHVAIEMQPDSSSPRRESSPAGSTRKPPSVRASTSALSPKALGKAAEKSAANVMSAYQVRSMIPAEVPGRVGSWNVPKTIYEHFLPSAPENVGALLTEYDAAIQQFRNSRPVDEARYDAFQRGRSVALDLEFRAAIQTRQAELLENAASLWNTARRTLKSEDLPENVAALFGTDSHISHAKLAAKASEMKKAAAQSWQQTSSAWDAALIDYLAAHRLDRKDLEAGFAKAGSPAYAARVIPPVLLSAAMAIPSYFHPDTAAQRFALTLGNFAVALAVAGFAHPTIYAMTTLTSVTWSDRLFNHASDIQNLLDTKMINEVDQQLQTALDEAGRALTAWSAVKDGGDPEAKSKALETLKNAAHHLGAAEHEYLMRADLNRVYIQGFQNQGIANGLKYYGNLSVGVISALFGSQWGANIQLGAAAAHFAAHMAISGDDEKSKQLRMFYLRMRASAPQAGESKAEELARFGNEIRDPFKVAQGALQQIFTARVRTLDTEIASALGIQPNEWRKVLAYRDHLAGGGEAANLTAEETSRALELERRIEQTMDSLSATAQKSLAEKMELRANTAQDIRHVAANAFSKVSDSNKGEVYLGLQVTPPASGVVAQLKNLFGPLTPEFRIGMRQGWARIKLPQEAMTTYGLAYWAAFQLGICGENGPLILSRFAQAMLAAGTYAKSGKSPTQKETIMLQAALTAINFAVTVTLMYAATRLLDIVVHPKGAREKINPLAGGRSSLGNTTYLAALLRDRKPQRAEAEKTTPDAGFQRAGLVTKDHATELIPTIRRRMAALAEESIPAGSARQRYLEGAELLDRIRQEIGAADPKTTTRIEEKNAARIETASL